jgi:hypothetical protein
VENIPHPINVKTTILTVSTKEDTGIINKLIVAPNIF